jgi:hypothetical protein
MGGREGIGMKDKVICPHCGATMMEYKHTLSEALVIGLTRLGQYKYPVNIKELKLTRNQWDNFQKLRYWGLCGQVKDIEGRRKNGVWGMTLKGRKFLRCEIAIPYAVYTYRGERVKSDESKFRSIVDVLPGYRYREDYVNDAEPHRG